MRSRLLVSLSLLLSASPTAAQRRVWVVDQAGGAGVDFTQIQPAIDAATPGDRVVVHDAVASYATFTLTKGLDIEGMPRASVTTPVIRDVPAGANARVAGFALTTYGTQGIPPLAVRNCRGSVLLASLTVMTGFVLLGFPSATVTDCDAVLVLDCQFWGWTSCPGLVVQATRLTAQRTVFGGGGGQDAMRFTGAGPGGLGLYATGSDLFLDHVTVRGGPGGRGYFQGIGCISPGGPGGSGLVTDSPTLVAGASTLAGGPGGAGFGVCPDGSPGLAVEAVGLPVRVTTDCTATGTLQNVTRIAPLPHIATPVTAGRGTPATFGLTARAGSVMLLWLDATHLHLPIPGIDGPVLLPLASALSLPLVVFGSGGSVPLTLPVPNDGALADQFVFLQGVAFPPTGLPSLSNLGDLRIR